MAQDLTFSLALGGGGARGLGHIPIIAALDELGLKPQTITGTSIGALVGAVYSSGFDAKQMNDYFIEYFAKTSEVIGRLWSLKPQSFSELWKRGLKISQFDLEAILGAFLPKTLPIGFDDLPIPLRAIAVDLLSAKMVVMDEGDLVSALAGSAALPGVFMPVRRNGLLLADGGLVNPVPSDCIQGTPDRIIAVDIGGFSENQFVDRNPTTIEALVAMTDASQCALTNARLQFLKPDLLLHPPVNGIFLLDFLKAKNILETVAPYKDVAKRQIAALFEGKG